MKLISLNIWGGRIHKPLLKFIKEQSKNIDIYCFQEVFKSEKNIFSSEIKTDIFSDIKTVLKDYNAYYAPVVESTNLAERVDFQIFWGQAIFVRKTLKVSSEDNIFIFGKYNQDYTLLSEVKDKKDYIDFPRLMQCVIIRENEKEILITNLHGYWIPDSKLDTPERLKQSDKIIKFLDSKKMPKVLCGDFNLNPGTKSMIKFEKNMTNLVKEYGIKNTRSKLHVRKDKFADYILISPEVSVNEFKLIYKDVSDHLPLYLDFKIK